MKQQDDATGTELINRLTEQIEKDDKYSEIKEVYDDLISEGLLTKPQYTFPLMKTI